MRTSHTLRTIYCRCTLQFWSASHFSYQKVAEMFGQCPINNITISIIFASVDVKTIVLKTNNCWISIMMPWYIKVKQMHYTWDRTSNLHCAVQGNSNSFLSFVWKENKIYLKKLSVHSHRLIVETPFWLGRNSRSKCMQIWKQGQYETSTTSISLTCNIIGHLPWTCHYDLMPLTSFIIEY